MATVTLTELRQRARELAGQETGAPSTAFVDTDENDKGINVALSAFHDLMVELQRHEHVVTPIKTHTATLSTSRTEYPLPDKLMETVSVRVSDGSRQWFVPPWDHSDRDWLENEHELPYIWGYRYRVIGRMIHILPTPQSAYTLHVDYVPEYSPLVNPGSTFECPYGWWEWAAVKAAIGMKAKGHTETTQLEQALAFEDRRIRAHAGKRGTKGLRIINKRRRGRLASRFSRLWRDS